MSVFRPFARVGAALAAGGLVLGLSAVSAGSQELETYLVVSGEYECVEVEGDYVWAIDYLAENLIEPLPEPGAIPAASGDIWILDADLYVGEEELGAVTFDPDVVPAGGTATASATLPGTFEGELVLAVDWVTGDEALADVELVVLDLDGSCVAPPTTTTSTTAAPGAANAAVVRPTFTG